ncbi:hypothetical protein [Plebeiibacterium sediminum]|uniref:DUF3887 domain-containing protein n=1 Tax=Plebeiibacterium sediminum TaxID=2992112 RepID=A0AAE3SHA2_9BACT|nr:hypothetical protein [Plebeiobacterium sediminum]MCW3789002.1 hypothetical protein [Plebeiobacterium sediminum]
MKNLLLLMLLLATISCSLGGDNKVTLAKGPLNSLFENFYELQESNKLMDLYNANIDAVQKNDQELRNKIKEEFAKAHKSVLDEMSKRFPKKSIHLPFSQEIKETVEVQDLFLADYSFPWGSATRLAYKVGFNCTKKSLDPINIVHLEFKDMEGDIIMTANTSIKESGYYELSIWPEESFAQFKDLDVLVF